MTSPSPDNRMPVRPDNQSVYERQREAKAPLLRLISKGT